MPGAPQCAIWWWSKGSSNEFLPFVAAKGGILPQNPAGSAFPPLNGGAKGCYPATQR